MPKYVVTSRDAYSKVELNKTAVGCIAFWVLAGVMVIVAVLAVSFIGVEYNERGFLRQKSTGKVDSETLFTAGLYCKGPDYEFKHFPSTAITIKFTKEPVFTSDRLTVQITGSAQYFIRKEQVQLLHKNYDLNYHDIIRNNFIDALKGAATVFSVREHFFNRSTVEQTLFRAVKSRLGGKCCASGCNLRGECAVGCESLVTCSESSSGNFVDLRFFQLTEFYIPSELATKFLRALVLQEETQTEKLKQQAQLQRKTTDQQVKQIQNEAAEIRQNATAQADLIVAQAEASASAILEDARNTGLENMFTQLGISDEKDKITFDYWRALRGSDKALLAVNFDKLIAEGP